MDQVTDYEIVNAMIKYGGGFVSDLGKLYYKADSNNQEKLKLAFPEYWKQYKNIAFSRRSYVGRRRTS